MSLSTNDLSFAVMAAQDLADNERKHIELLSAYLDAELLTNAEARYNDHLARRDRFQEELVRVVKLRDR